MADLGSLAPDRLIFIDETGASTNMVRLYGRCPIGQRLISKTPWGHWKTTTFTAGLRRDGLDPAFRPTPAPERLDTLTVPTLAIWATEDAAFKSAQDQLIAALRAAAKTSKSMAFWWKQYGIRPPPASATQ